MIVAVFVMNETVLLVTMVMNGLVDVVSGWMKRKAYLDGAQVYELSINVES